VDTDEAVSKSPKSSLAVDVAVKSPNPGSVTAGGGLFTVREVELVVPKESLAGVENPKSKSKDLLDEELISMTEVEADWIG
jgi:hypothetical protein